MTNSYLVPALILLALGGVGFVFSWMIALPIMVCAGGLFAASTGVQINTDTKEYRNYMSFFGYKIGSWSSLSTIVQVTLILSTERATLKGLIPGSIPMGRSSTVQVRTYDILLNDGISSFELNDFLTYKKAHAVFDILTRSMEISGRDYVAEKLASNRAKRSR